MSVVTFFMNKTSTNVMKLKECLGGLPKMPKCEVLNTLHIPSRWQALFLNSNYSCPLLPVIQGSIPLPQAKHDISKPLLVCAVVNQEVGMEEYAG